MSALACWQQLSQGSLIRTGDDSAERREACSTQALAASLSRISRVTTSQNFNFLFRQRQLRNNRGNFIEYLEPALHLTAIFRALHGFISNEGEFRLAVSEILK